MAFFVMPGHAQDVPAAGPHERSTMYLNGGVGQDEQEYMHKSAKDWSLRLTFSESKDNNFVANVGLLVTDLAGTPRLQLDDAGPMTFARLPAGKYRVAARYHGQTETREVTLDGTTGRDVNFHWNGPGE
jgi:hypothetical protein